MAAQQRHPADVYKWEFALLLYIMSTQNAFLALQQCSRRLGYTPEVTQPCSVFKCSSVADCSGGGICSAAGVCQCDAGRAGVDCSVLTGGCSTKEAGCCAAGVVDLHGSCCTSGVVALVTHRRELFCLQISVGS